MWKKILGVFILTLFFAGSICGCVYGIKYNNLLSSQQSTIEYVQTIENLEDKIDLLTNENSSLNDQIHTLTIGNDANKTRLSELEAEKTALEEEKAELVEQGNADATTIADLQSQIEEKDAEIQSLTATIEEKDTQIATLEADKLALQNEITRLTGLLESYEDLASTSYEVSFYAGEVNLKTVAVKNGKSVEETPISEDYIITGWQLEDGTAVDPLTYVIEGNTTFYAQIAYTATFMKGDSVISTIQVADGEKLTDAPTLSSNDTMTFNGWALEDSSEVVDFTTYAFTSNQTFVALCEYKDLSFSLSSLETNNSLNAFSQFAPLPDSANYYSTISASINGVSESSKIKIEGYLITGFSTFEASTDIFATPYAFSEIETLYNNLNNFYRTKITLSDDLVITLGQEYEVRGGMTVKFELVNGLLQLSVSGQPSYNNMSTTPFNGGALSYIYFKVI